MSYKAVIFDLDGTALDTLADLKNSVNYALSKHSLPERSLKEIRAFVGNGIQKLIERSVPENTAPELFDAVFADFKVHYREHCADETGAYDGIKDVLLLLKERGIRTAVVSNKAHFEVCRLCEIYFDGLFEACAGERDGIRKKPAPDAVNALIEQFGLEKSDCVYIGDSETDIKTAQNAGIDCVSVLWGFRDEAQLRENGATFFVKTCKELAEYLLKNI